MIKQHFVIKMLIQYIQNCIHGVCQKSFFEVDTHTLEKWKNFFLEGMEIMNSSRRTAEKNRSGSTT
jgi:hypothetical protein